MSRSVWRAAVAALLGSLLPLPLLLFLPLTFVLGMAAVGATSGVSAHVSRIGGRGFLRRAGVYYLVFSAATGVSTILMYSGILSWAESLRLTAPLGVVTAAAIGVALARAERREEAREGRPATRHGVKRGATLLVFLLASLGVAALELRLSATISLELVYLALVLGAAGALGIW